VVHRVRGGVAEQLFSAHIYFGLSHAERDFLERRQHENSAKMIE
jgi:hypothetical protein